MQIQTNQIISKVTININVFEKHWRCINENNLGIKTYLHIFFIQTLALLLLLLLYVLLLSSSLSPHCHHCCCWCCCQCGGFYRKIFNFKMEEFQVFFGNLVIIATQSNMMTRTVIGGNVFATDFDTLNSVLMGIIVSKGTLLLTEDWKESFWMNVKSLPLLFFRLLVSFNFFPNKKMKKNVFW